MCLKSHRKHLTNEEFWAGFVYTYTIEKSPYREQRWVGDAQPIGGRSCSVYGLQDLMSPLLPLLVRRLGIEPSNKCFTDTQA